MYEGKQKKIKFLFGAKISLIFEMITWSVRSVGSFVDWLVLLTNREADRDRVNYSHIDYIILN